MAKRPFTPKDYVAGYEYFRNLSQEKAERIKEIEFEIARLKEQIIEFGGHKPECPSNSPKFIRPSMPCKCGWAKIEQALKGD